MALTLSPFLCLAHTELALLNGLCTPFSLFLAPLQCRACGWTSTWAPAEPLHGLSCPGVAHAPSVGGCLGLGFPPSPSKPGQPACCTFFIMSRPSRSHTISHTCTKEVCHHLTAGGTQAPCRLSLLLEQALLASCPVPMCTQNCKSH